VQYAIFDLPTFRNPDSTCEHPKLWTAPLISKAVLADVLCSGWAAAMLRGSLCPMSSSKHSCTQMAWLMKGMVLTPATSLKP